MGAALYVCFKASTELVDAAGLLGCCASQRRRSPLQNLPEAKQRKLVSAMANQSEPFGWSLTSSCKVFPVSIDGTIAGWIIRLLKLKRKGGRKSK
jgi:hypothetical protein